VPPPPIVPPPPPPPGVADTSIVFALTGRTTQKPLVRKAGIVVRLSCPLEACRVALKGTVTVPAARRGVKANKLSLKGVTVSVAKGVKVNRRFTISTTMRTRLAAALRNVRTRTRVTAIISATATDAAGNKSVKSLKLKLRR
jgi:hypothetical protein